ncbi:MAG TPA: glycogen debranching N-terminal domain-containing protein [Acidimicrobiales bacterium]|nr:glycogen debranching N-terminal domain-containing protein [Acidimicrobiales bacterium]
MPDPWIFSGESAPVGSAAGGVVTLVEGSAFGISAASGDIEPGSTHGIFFRDTRFLSRFALTINGHSPEPLAATTTDPFSAVFVGRERVSPGTVESRLLVFRYRYVGRGMREDVVVRNYGAEPAFCALELTLACDFAGLFEVKEGRAVVEGEVQLDANEAGLLFDHRRGGNRRGTRITFSQPTPIVGDGVARYEIMVPPGGEWTTCLVLAPVIEGEEIEPRYGCGQPVERATPVERLNQWRRDIPVVETDHDGLQSVVARSVEDLGALRIFDPDHPDRAIVAAGAPWFMALFGRDSLITAWMALLADPDLALGVLQTLARFQGADVDPRNDEQPGRILHEMRFGEGASLSFGGGRVYYGSADSTPLFVMLLGELRRWGLAREAVDQLLPHADRALDWIEHHGDGDGDGYVEYQRGSDRGLQNQGWKDSWDGIRYQDGRVAETPIALAEVQAYVYGAYLARAHFADEAGDEATAARFRHKATDLKEAFNRDFWLEDRQWFAVGLDPDKRPIDSLTSNLGHCLWAGIVDEDKAAAVAAHLVSPAMFSGWGVRTLATTMGGYNPISYHCGSVWPHDNAIVAAGLMRYGFVTEAQDVIMAMVDAGVTQGGRLPELFSGLARDEFPTVVSYPTSCSPQAWAAGSSLLFLRTLLRFDPWVPHGRLWLRPVLPEGIEKLHVHRIPLAGGRVTVRVEDGKWDVEGLPPGIELVEEPRNPLTASGVPI